MAVCPMQMRVMAPLPRLYPWLIFPFLCVWGHATQHLGGVNVHFLSYASALGGNMTMLGKSFGISRTDLRWYDVEMVKGEYNFSQADAHVEQHEQAGVKVWFILNGHNDLYTKRGYSPVGKEQVDAFVAFAIAAMQRYQNRVKVWELWNEPNLLGWVPLPNPQHYIELALALGKAKSVLAPNSFLVGPGSFGVAKDFASKLINGGILDVFDGWSFHPYRWGGPESVVHDFSVLSSLLTTGGRQIPIISGEWGYSTCHEKNNPNKPVLCILGAMPDIISRPLQGRYLARQWLINTMLRSPISIWYDWMDDSTKPLEGESNFGVVTADGKPKPAYVAAMVLQHYIFSPNQAQNFSGRLNASLTGSNKTNEALYALCFGTSSSDGTREKPTCSVIAVWASRTIANEKDGQDICIVATSNEKRQDCGYWGIERKVCEARGCCFAAETSSGPQCFRPNTTVSIHLPFLRDTMTYERVYLDSGKGNSTIASRDGVLNVTDITDEPVLLKLIIR